MRDKIISLINKVFGQDEEKGSKGKAIERLKLVLISDRSNLSPQILEKLKEDLINCISKYMEIDISELDVYLERGENEVALTASMPVKRVKRIRGVRVREK